MIILANGKTNEVAQRTDDTEALWIRLGELPATTGLADEAARRVPGRALRAAAAEQA